MKLVIVFAAVLIAAACPSSGDPEFTGRLSSKHSVKSPKGVTINSGLEIPSAIPPAADRGLDKVFSIAEAPPNNYHNFKRHSHYTIWLFPRNREKCQQAAVYRFYDRTTVYDQGPFDKDPRPGKTGLCFAGFMLRQNIGPAGPLGDPGMLIVDDAQTVETVVWYEAEHNILLESDGPRYALTADLHDHPILGYGPPPAPCECVREPCDCSKSSAVPPARARLIVVTLDRDLSIEHPAGYSIEAVLTR